jgi:dipeptidyl aminopeptidase/acylaminoacyl peptidase
MRLLHVRLDRARRLATLVACAGVLAAGSPAVRPAAAQATPAPGATRDSIRRFTVDAALDVSSYGAAGLSPDGRWLAATSSSRRDALGADFSREGDPTYVRPGASRVWVVDTRSGAARAVFPDRRNVRSLVWSPDGRRLAMLVLRGETFEPVIWDRERGTASTVPAPAGRYVAETGDVQWTANGTGLLLTLRTVAWRDSARAQFRRQTTGPVTVQSSSEPFLAWDELRRRGNVRTLARYDLATRRWRDLIPESAWASYTMADDESALSYAVDITKKTDYDVIFGSETRLLTRTLGGADTAARVLLPTLRSTTLVWSPDGTRYAYSRDGRVWVASVRDTAARQIAGPAAGARGDTATADTTAGERARRAKERFAVSRFSPAGDALLLSNSEGLWLADPATGSKEMFVTTPDSTSQAPRTTVAAWSEDGQTIYLATASRTRWERGLARYDRRTRQTTQLVRDARTYSNVRLSKDGGTMVLNIAEGNRPADVYAADADFGNVRRLTDANPTLRATRLGKTELLSYLDADGKTRYAVVYYPADYEAGKRYPTVFNPYEEFFDDSFDATANVLTANDYLVVKPSVGFDIGYPGEAWVKGVTSAANKLIEMGVADSARLGVHGTSYGGYATNLLITQTRRFKAAINISGKVDMISFYTDSPRLGVRNVHAAEKSQDRIGATLWQQPQKYVQHSAVMFADRIETPLLLITGGEDHNVPALNTREMYYALRRLGKEVTWVNYVNGGHGTPTTNAAEFTDYHRRILAWYDRYLKGASPKKEVSAGGR